MVYQVSTRDAVLAIDSFAYSVPGDAYNLTLRGRSAIHERGLVCNESVAVDSLHTRE
jgi:hypothetical protein